MEEIAFVDALPAPGLIIIKSLVPAGILVALTFVAIVVSAVSPPLPSFLRSFVRQEHLRPSECFGGTNPVVRKAPAWKIAVLSSVAAAEAAGWIGFAGWTFASTHSASRTIVESSLMVISWSYLALAPILKPPVTAPWCLGILFLAHLVYTFAHLLTYTLATATGPFWSLETTLHIIALVPEVVLIAVFASFPLQPFEKPLRSSDDKNPEVGPEDYVTVFEWAAFTWAAPIVAAGRARKLEADDIYDLSPSLKTEVIARRFREIKRKTLVGTVVASNGQDLFIYISLSILSAFLVYVPPFLLNRILTAFSDATPASRRYIAVLAVLTLVINMIKAESDLFLLWHSRRAAMRSRACLMAEIYRKALKRRDMSGVIREKVQEVGDKEKPEGKESTGADIGKVVNLMSSDATMISNQLIMLSYIISAPFELIVAIAFLYRLMGWSALAGLCVMILALPVNWLISKIGYKVSQTMRDATDARMTAVTEIIESCRTIKYFAWETIWLERVFKARDVELAWLFRDRIVGIILNLLWTIVPDAISLVSFFCYTKLAGEQLTIPIAFTALALFAQIRQPLNILPQGILGLLQTWVSVKRISTFLGEPEIPEWVSSLEEIHSDSTQRIALEHATFVWKHDSTDNASVPAETALPTVATEPAATQRVFELSDITVEFPVGELSLITGPTGSGKTSMLMALLGEMNCVSGEIHLPKSLLSFGEDGLTNSTGYCAQKPWLEHASIKDNILFGSELDQARYDEVVDACALVADFKVLEDGDATEIGEKGVSLSGGQKARVALARAAYSRARHVLLDDPLSAVDHHTAKHIYERLFLGPIMKRRTLILVTHHVALCLPTARYLVNLSEGTVNESIRDPSSSDPKALAIVAEAAKDDVGTADVAEADGSTSPTRSESTNSTAAASEENSKTFKAPPVTDTKPRKLVTDEARAEGGVKWSVYNTYLSAVGYWLWGAIIAFIALARCVPVAQQLWLKFWGESYSDSFKILLQSVLFASPISTSNHHHLAEGLAPSLLAVTRKLPPASENVDPYLWIYFFIAVFYSLTVVIANVLESWGTIRAARSLFRATLTRVVRAPSRWFDITPVGRILNRFSSDFETVDWRLDMSVQQVILTFFGLLSALVVIFVTIPWFMIPAAFLALAYANLGYSYIETTRDIRRLMSTAKSPIFSGFGETLAGIVTIRAFAAESRFQGRLFKMVDAFGKQDWGYWMSNRYLLLRFDLMGAVAVFFTVILAVATKPGPGLAALAIVSAQSLVLNIYWLIRFVTLLEVDLNAIERIDELLRTEQEPPSVIDSNRPPAVWPSDVGGLVIEDLVIRYAPDLPAVIQGLSVSFLPREKIGVVGRTGSGKSTLAMSLLRFVDPSEGRIMQVPFYCLDGLDIVSIGLEDLRSRVTIIPQEAVLFSGTVKSNLDPFDEHTDEDLWDVLDSVRLSNGSSRPSAAPTPLRIDSQTNLIAATELATGSNTPAGAGRISIASLDAPVSAGGGNYSQGQRQLLALARSLLRRSKVIIMDEATASVDFQTDAIIQTAIRDGFKDALVITIAHRLATVLDYDKILVLDHGRLAEFDTPKALLQNADGVFRSMCQKGADWAEVKAKFDTN